MRWVNLIVLVAVITGLVLLDHGLKRNIDPYANADFHKILNMSNIPIDEYKTDLKNQLSSNISDFAKGDIYLVLGRLENDTGLICRASDYYKSYIRTSTDSEMKALAYESIASLNCTKPGKSLLAASKLWRELGINFRANLLADLANHQETKIYFRTYNIPTIRKSVDRPVIGSAKLELTADDTLLTQTERVTRDWLSAQINEPKTDELLRVFSERYHLSTDELQKNIGWHEGARVEQIKQVGLTHDVATGTLVRRINNKWYAPDEHGVFTFQVPDDKVWYPTTRYLTDDLAMIIDTHGINMIVEQAIRMNATAVLGCCDYPGKIAAADYLAGKGIKVICPTDRFVSDLLYTNNTGMIIGSAPIKIEGDRAIIGDRPITLTGNVVVSDIHDSQYSMFYYDTPARYFRHLGYSNVTYVNITSNQDVINMANDLKSNFISVRVYSKEDYEYVSEWLKADVKHKAILFHSIPYPYGYRIFEEFPTQTSFGDIDI